jgi:hypothetical protein
MAINVIIGASPPIQSQYSMDDYRHIFVGPLVQTKLTRAANLHLANGYFGPCQVVGIAVQAEGINTLRRH